jgi:HAMP domain-containing protein
MSGLHSLATIIKRLVADHARLLAFLILSRLEAATSRVEDAAHELEKKRSKADDPADESGPSAVPDTSLSAIPPPPPAPVAAEPQSILAYDEIAGTLRLFLDLTRSFEVPSLIEQV